MGIGAFAIEDSVGAGYHKGKLEAGMQGSGHGLFNEEGLDVRCGRVVEGGVHEKEFLTSIRCLIGSQWSSIRMGVICPCFLVWVMRQEAAFWTH